MALDRTVSVKLKAEVAGYMASLKQAGTATSSFAKGIETGATKNREHLDKLAGGLAVVGTVAAAGVGAAVLAFADFDQAMSGVEAATHESVSNMNLLRDAALEAGAQTQFSATEAANAVEELAKAGVSTADILGGGLTGALDLAAAGSLDVGAAAEIAASAMTQFSLSGTDLPHVADLLAAAAGKAQGSVEDMGMALGQSGLVAATFDYSIEETTGILAEFAAAGLTGSDAGTSLKTMLLRLANPSEEAAAAMKEFGIAAYDAGGTMATPTELAGQLQAGMQDLEPATRDAALATIFGSDALRAAAILYKDGAEEAANWEDAVNDTGFAAETARIKMDNLKGDLESLRGALNKLFIEGGEGSSGFLREAIQNLTDFTRFLSNMDPDTKAAVLGIGAVVAAGALLAAGTIKVVTALGTMKTSLQVLGVQANVTAGQVGKAALGFGVVVGAAIAADAALRKMGEAQVPDLDTDHLTQQLLDLGTQGELTGDQIALFGSNIHAFGGDAKTSDEAMGALVDTMREAGGSNFWDKVDRIGTGGADMAKLTKQMTTMDGALADLVTSGHGEIASRQMDQLRKAALEAHLPLKDLDKLLPEYTQALKDIPSGAPKVEKTTAELQEQRDAFIQLNPLAKTAEEVTKDYTDRQKDAATKVSEHAEALDHLLENLGLLNNTAVDTTRAQLDFLDAISRTKDEIKEAGTSLDDNTQKGRDNVNWMLDGIEAAETLAAAVQKKSAETESDGDATKDANKSYADSIDKLRTAAEAAGLSKDAVDKLIEAHARVKPVVETIFNNPGLDKSITHTKDFKGWLNKLPQRRQVAISVPGAEGAAAQVKAVRDYVNELHDKAITIRTRYESTASVVTGSAADAEARRQGLGRAAGGYITGPGSGTSDSIPTWLSNGEYVINAAATSANRSLLDAINRGGLARGDTARRAPTGYASGGPVQARRGITLEQHVTVANLDELNRKTQSSLRDSIAMANLRGM